MPGEIIPFGKYKGRPVEALTQDTQYVDWLTAQPWFRERFANFYTLIVNQTGEPAETPAHNRLQAMFLAPVFQARFAAFLFPKWQSPPDMVKFEVAGFDVRLFTPRGELFTYKDGDSCCGSADCHIEIKPTIGDEYPAVLRQMRAAISQSQIRPTKYNNFGMGQEEVTNPVLFLEQYTGTGATEEQFIAIFESANIRVVFLDEVC